MKYGLVTGHKYYDLKGIDMSPYCDWVGVQVVGRRDKTPDDAIMTPLAD